MICPFRVDTEFEHEVISGVVVCKAKREVYSLCMGYECPAYVDRYGDGSEGYCSNLEGNDYER